MLIAVASLVYAWRGGDFPGLDFYQFWAGAQLAPEGGRFYNPELPREQYRLFYERASALEPSGRMTEVASARDRFDFSATPFLYAAFGVFGERYERDLFIYRVLTLAAFCGGVLLFARAAGLSWAASSMLLAFTLTLFQPLKSEMRVGNVNSLQLFAIALAVWLARERDRRRAIATGALLAIVTAFKPNLAFVVPLLLAYRLITRDRLRLLWETIGAAVGAAFAVLVSSVYFRSFDCWIDWLSAARGVTTTVQPLSSGNVAPFLALATKYGPTAMYAIAAVLLAVIIAALWCGARLRRAFASPRGAPEARTTPADLTPFVVALALLVYLLSATLVWLHYLILAVPAAIALIADTTSGTRRFIGILALTLIGDDLWLSLFGVHTASGEAVILWSGLALLFSASLWRLSTR